MLNEDQTRDLAAKSLDHLPFPTAVVLLHGERSRLEYANHAFRNLDNQDASHSAIDPRLLTAARGSIASGGSVDTQLGDGGGLHRVRAWTIEGDLDAGTTLITVQFRRLSNDEVQKHELRSTINQLRDLVDNSAALMYIKDLDGRYLIVNEFFARMFKVDAAQIVGKTDHDLFPESSAIVYSGHDTQVIETGESIEVEEPFAGIGGATDPDDDRRWLSIKFPLLTADGVPYALGAISTDISDRKRAQSAANRAMHEAERANRSKNEFLSRMSHELRTPLNAIIGFAQLAVAQETNPSLREDLTQILDAGRHLLGLVNDVLDITWIESGSPGLTTTPVPAIDSIHQALELMRPLARAADIEIASDLHGALHKTILADTKRLKQVFLNVLGNAVKFNRARGAILVRCVERDGFLRFLVTDTGTGMAKEDVDRLFQPFVRLEAAADQEGSGLGLALSRSLVEQMGGRLGVARTAPGEGSTFFVEIPIADSPHHVTADPPLTTQLARVELTQQTTPANCNIGGGAASGDDTKTLLHIEDTPANIRLVNRIVEAMGGLGLITESSGRRGIELAKKAAPAAILLDLNLVDMSGVDVARELHAAAETSHIPVIILSADATPARIAQLRAIGIFDYLTKPLDVRDFADTVRRALAAS